MYLRGPSPQNVQVCAHVDYSNFLCTDPGELDSCFNLVHVGICWHGRFIRKWRLKFNYLLPWQLHSNSVVTSCFLHWNEVQHGFKPFRSITFICWVLIHSLKSSTSFCQQLQCIPIRGTHIYMYMQVVALLVQSHFQLIKLNFTNGNANLQTQNAEWWSNNEKWFTRYNNSTSKSQLTRKDVRKW